MFDSAFAVAVHEYSALLCLRGADAADVDKGLDDVIEGVDVVVVEHQATS